MIRKNKKQHRPLYREIVPAAIKGAWRHRWLWPIALVAGLVQTGGIVDAVLLSLKRIRLESVTLFDASWADSLNTIWGRIVGAQDVLEAILQAQNLVVAVTIVIATLLLSFICQGALVYGIGGSVHGKLPGFRESLHVGAINLGRVFALNVVTLGLTWLARFLLLVPLAVFSEEPSSALALASVGMAVLYILAVLSLTAIHFFSLNAIVLQGAHVTPALERAALMLRASWVTVIEIALILFGVGMLTFGLGLALFVAMWLPLFLLQLGAALMNFETLFVFANFLGSLLFFLVMLSAGAFNLSFQYRAWNLLFVRLGEGGAVAKMHRVLRGWLGIRA
ncbi:hypothetical protein EDM68_02760 [Candidatus Uhrbacteria bacterium]|nr:MAG: hypothetical protein EDM68_02760 [Candidatus Uhrbacteria bacterium]